MAQTKTVLVACGTAVATSTVVANSLEEAMAARGIRIETRQCKATEVPSLIDQADLVVSTTPLPPNLPKPAIVTLAFLTGIGRDAEIEKIAKILAG
ncbi:PTS sugar transporter subunit IIB [Pannonibacter sp. Q-1]|jgi:PTS system galactitol-specific IIB component|uniref:PTS galactitol transporter subunit IIB n=2 Tax=Pannonibacter TaxID=227873 RepID=A0A0L0IZD9_9HYPH|nr:MULTISPECIES: PTS sugar transporter subunit IIB [Pannonibacter]ALV26720.1 PTS galactitol transporter subunit IIB [Pannonibacter phragmitetus]KND18525.1 PTS galactitol transporter subunit IIB [Pannonibacter phragmitetus]MBA4206603.1 shikimate dehydrogenase [Polymorphum sp.]CUA93443.1 Phosphotransferase system, galactitol-specific IIB component [Pannonibacter indicus]